MRPAKILIGVAAVFAIYALAQVPAVNPFSPSSHLVPGGPAGPSGIQGPTGPAGAPSGLSGLSGLSGIQGTTGPSGLSGLSGIASTVAGASGLSGLSGLSGIQGATGLSGLSGIQGATGLSGLSGLSGVPGVSTTANPPTCAAGTALGTGSPSCVVGSNSNNYRGTVVVTVGTTPTTGLMMTLTWASTQATGVVCDLWQGDDSAASQVNVLAGQVTFYYDFAGSSTAAGKFYVGSQSPALRTASFNPFTLTYRCN